LSTSPPVEWWLRKVSYILRKHYRRVELQATWVSVAGYQFYDVVVREPLSKEDLYIDSLDKEDVNKLMRAFNTMCNPRREHRFRDGLLVEYECRIA